MHIFAWSVVGVLSAFTAGAAAKGLGLYGSTRNRDKNDAE